MLNKFERTSVLCFWTGGSKMDKLSARQKEILEFIRRSIDRHGYPPSVREIGAAVGLSSSSTVHAHLMQLAKKGFIKRDRTKPRAIEVTGYNAPIVHVPVVGRVAAGEPILAVENIEDTFPLPLNFLKSSDDLFMLTVRGDSMIKVGILDGDYIIVRQQNSADDGDIVVALLGDNATVKRFFREADAVRLQPENDALEPIISKDVTVLGRVVGIVRNLE
jgi:repressor LexA